MFIRLPDQLTSILLDNFFKSMVLVSRSDGWRTLMKDI